MKLRRFAVLVWGAILLSCLVAPTGANGIERGPESAPGHLWGVAGLDGAHAWAVGGRGDGPSEVLIEAWDGQQWTRQAGQNPAPGGINELHAVDAGSPSNVWAVGKFVRSDQRQPEPLIEHWDGTGWSRVPAPCPASRGASCDLHGVSVLSTTNVWAVGDDEAGVLIEHWDGHRWHVVAAPQSHQLYSGLLAVTARGPRDIWAVGSTSVHGKVAALVEHWDGTAWRMDQEVTANLGFAELAAASAVTRRHVWAVGDSVATSGEDTLTVRWNGERWAPRPSDNPWADDFLQGVGGTPGVRLFAVGYGEFGDRAHALIERWNGKRWVDVPVHVPGSSVLSDVVETSKTSGWAVGTHIDAGGLTPLVLRWTGIGHGWHEVKIGDE